MDADNWEFTSEVVAGVGLTILAGIAISGGIGYFTGLRGEDLTKEWGSAELWVLLVGES